MATESAPSERRIPEKDQPGRRGSSRRGGQRPPTRIATYAYDCDAGTGIRKTWHIGELVGVIHLACIYDAEVPRALRRCRCGWHFGLKNPSTCGEIGPDEDLSGFVFSHECVGGKGSDDVD